jgi:hypothetical protein
VRRDVAEIWDWTIAFHQLMDERRLAASDNKARAEQDKLWDDIEGGLSVMKLHYELVDEYLAKHSMLQPRTDDQRLQALLKQAMQVQNRMNDLTNERTNILQEKHTSSTSSLSPSSSSSSSSSSFSSFDNIARLSA